MEHKPFAVTLDPGSSRADKTGSWRTERAVYVDRLPPCSNACPAGEDIREWLYEAESGDAGYERAWRRIMEHESLPRCDGSGLLSPLRNRVQPGTARRGSRRSTRSSASSVTRRSASAGPSREPPPSTGKRVLVVGAGPSGLAAAYHLALRGHAVTIKEAMSAPGGMMRFGIPTLPAAEGGPRRRDRQDRRTSVWSLQLRHEGGGSRRDDHGGVLRRRVPRGRCPGRQACLHPRRLRLARARRRVDAARPGRRANAHSSVGQWRCTAAATRRSTRPARPSASGPRTRWWSTGVPETGCPPTRSRCARRSRRAVLFRWLSTIDRIDDGRVTVEQMELDDTGFPQPTGRYERAAPPTPSFSRWDRTADLRLLGRRRGTRRRARASSQVDAVADDRPSRRVRRR